MAQAPLTSAAADRNKDPILHVLRRVLPKSGVVLEIASGTGQHAEHFARHLPGLVWQPSDPDPEMCDTIEARRALNPLANLRAALALDVLASPWPIQRADAVLCINMIHIAAWSATIALMQGAARLLASRGVLVLYGPYRREGVDTAPSNESFDRQLRARHPAWGLRELETVVAAAAQNGLVLDEVVEMPANNLCVILR